MAFAPLDVFRRIEAAHARHLRRFHALAIETSGHRMLVASRGAADFGAHSIMQALPLVSLALEPEVVCARGGSSHRRSATSGSLSAASATEWRRPPGRGWRGR